jgi:hypothetical protein
MTFIDSVLKNVYKKLSFSLIFSFHEVTVVMNCD